MIIDTVYWNSYTPGGVYVEDSVLTSLEELKSLLINLNNSHEEIISSNMQGIVIKFIGIETTTSFDMDTLKSKIDLIENYTIPVIQSSMITKEDVQKMSNKEKLEL